MQAGNKKKGKKDKGRMYGNQLSDANAADVQNLYSVDPSKFIFELPTVLFRLN